MYNYKTFMCFVFLVSSCKVKQIPTDSLKVDYNCILISDTIDYKISVENITSFLKEDFIDFLDSNYEEDAIYIQKYENASLNDFLIRVSTKNDSAYLTIRNKQKVFTRNINDNEKFTFKKYINNLEKGYFIQTCSNTIFGGGLQIFIIKQEGNILVKYISHPIGYDFLNNNEKDKLSTNIQIFDFLKSFYPP